MSTIATGIKLKIENDMFDKNEAMEGLDTLNNTTQRLSRTIDDFRNFFKVDNKKVDFNVAAILLQDMKLLEGSIKNNHIELIPDFEDGIYINGYQNEFSQAMLNIINNAKDAVCANDEIERYIFVTLRKEKNSVIITVRDNGGGIKQDISDKIYEPYFSTKYKSDGTGIGLYMTKQIIEDHMGGTIDVKNVKYLYNSKEQIGAEFTVTLKS